MQLKILEKEWPGGIIFKIEEASSHADHFKMLQNNVFKLLFNEPIDPVPERPELTKKLFAEYLDALYLILKGTELEIDVWKQLLKIPVGTTITYQQVAIDIGREKAVRTVANAIAKNKVAYLIPCHRVVGENGNIMKYAGGARVKLEMLKYEGAISQEEYQKNIEKI